MKTLSAVLLLTLSALPTNAEEWISLGEIPNMTYELDRSSIVKRDGAISVRMRVRAPDGNRIALMLSNLSVHCSSSYIQVESGQMGFQGERMIPFKGEDLDRENRIIILPTPNIAFNNIYKFVC